MHPSSIPETGLEPARLAALDPKSSVSANSTTPARMFYRSPFVTQRGSQTNQREMCNLKKTNGVNDEAGRFYPPWTRLTRLVETKLGSWRGSDANISAGEYVEDATLKLIFSPDYVARPA